MKLAALAIILKWENFEQIVKETEIFVSLKMTIFDM